MRITPLGSEVLPEVNWRKATSSGLSTGRRGAAVAAASSATVATRSRVGICALISRASGSTSGMAISTRAWAVLRMPAWRRRWSSSWLGRTGG